MPADAVPDRDPIRVRRLVEQLPAVTFELERGGLPEDMFFTYLSPQVAQITGYSAEEVTSDVRLFAQAVHPADRVRVVAEVVRVSAELDQFDSEFRIVTPDGRIVWLHARATPVTTDDGGLRWQGIALDVTEQKTGTEALRTAEERYRAVVQNTWDLIVLADRNAEVVYASPSHRAVLGLDPELLVGTDVHERVGPADAELSRSSFTEALWGIRQPPTRLTMRKESGEQVVLEGTGWQPVFDDEGAVKLVLMIARDVTARVRVERERSELFAKIVETQEQERARIASDLHDDPAQALTALGLQIAELASESSEDAVRERLGELGSSVERTVGRLRDLTFRLWPLALETGLAAAVDEYLLRELGETLAFEVRSTLEPEPPMPTRVVAYRVVQEALENVGRHAQASSVLVTLTRDRDRLVVRLEDDGIGFDPAAGESDPKHVGLRAMRERVELAGGVLAIHSRPSGGAAIEFRLPIP